MAEKMFKNPRIRVPRRIKKGSLIEVRVKVQHNSYTGLTIEDGKYKAAEPPYYLRKMVVTYGSDVVSSYDMTSATSPNPLIRFKMIADKEAPLTVEFENSEGKKKNAKTQVKFG